MMVIDKSGSMFSNSYGSETRWSALYNQLQIDLPEVEGVLDLGLQLFPRSGAAVDFNIDSCSTATEPEVLTGPLQATGVLGALPPNDATGEGGATPLAAALERAYDHLRVQDPASERIAIVVTDGGANCRADLVADAITCGGDITCSTEVVAAWETFDDTVLSLVDLARTMDDITTYFVGMSIVDFDPFSGISCGSDADCPAGTACCGVTPNISNCPQNNTCGYPWGTPKDVNHFEEIGFLGPAGGGGPAYLAVDSAASLNNALGSIFESITDCTVEVLTPPNPFQQGNVTLEVLGLVPSSQEFPGGLSGGQTACLNGEDGWYWSSSFDEIQLCGTYCDAWQSAGQVNLTYGCP